MKKIGIKILFVLACILCASQSYAQEELDSTYMVSDARQPFGTSYLRPYAFNTFPTLYSDSIPARDFSTEVGMSAFTDFDGGYGFNTYVAPKLSYQVSKRWRLDFMGTMGATTAYNMPYAYNWTTGELMSGDLRYNYLGGYAQAVYDITPKLYAGASVYGGRAFNVDTPMNESMRNLGNVGTSMFVGYKFSESVTVEAEISINKRQSPYGGYGAGNPHGWLNQPRN